MCSRCRHSCNLCGEVIKPKEILRQVCGTIVPTPTEERCARTVAGLLVLQPTVKHAALAVQKSCTKTTKRSRCTASIEALNPKQLPRTLSDVQEFLCLRCRYITCIRKNAQGIRCGKEMPKKSKAKLPEHPKEQYVCGVCQNLDEAKKV